MSSERDRVRRYRRPATVVFLEVEHLDRLSELWGEDVAAQSLVRIGRTIMRQIRSSDHCARIDTSRFAVFLPETDEIAAINFVERIRASMEESLGLMADTIHVAIGWASPTDGNLDSALESRRAASQPTSPPAPDPAPAGRPATTAQSAPAPVRIRGSRTAGPSPRRRPACGSGRSWRPRR
jgi:diguanylate cyclase (GGDEF)-like protein